MNHSRISLYVFSSLLMMLFIALIPEVARAQMNLTDTADKICDFYDIIMSQIAYGIAVFSISSLGISAFFGKVKWGQFFLVTSCIAGLFASMSIAESFTGVTSGCDDYVTTTGTVDECGARQVRESTCEEYDECPDYTELAGESCEMCNTLWGISCVREMEGDAEEAEATADAASEETTTEEAATDEEDTSSSACDTSTVWSAMSIICLSLSLSDMISSEEETAEEEATDEAETADCDATASRFSIACLAVSLGGLFGN